jgi:Holliday junction resolvase RusA-like endonuclease
MKYRAFADECRLKGVKVGNGCEIIFYIPMPKSWSKVNKSIMIGAGHKKRPDVDNLLKALMDAVLPEDSHIHDIAIKKVWAINGAIEIKSIEGE